MTDYYRSLLYEADLMISIKQIDIKKFYGAWNLFYKDLRAIFRSVFANATNENLWIIEIARKQDAVKHPVQHILFEMFLDQLPRRTPPFGSGPWACPCPVADHKKGALTIKHVVEENQGYAIVGRFACYCGYTYTMSKGKDGKLRGPRYSSYGPLLEPALTKLVEKGTTLTGAASFLGVHTRVIAAVADRLGLGMNWKTTQRAHRRAQGAFANRGNGQVDPNASRLRKPRKPRTDWVALDLEMRAKVEIAVDAIRCVSPPIIISRRQVERDICRHENWLYLRRFKLPITTAWLATQMETTEQFQERRLRDAVKRKAAAGEAMTVSSLVRSAGLKYEIWSDTARQLLVDAAQHSRLT
ncbi:MAG: hypothetical protein ABS49_08615 [Erythrobacter sp. SCN 62-14]|nr:MAG: hypothetical protein ABS49_08615 [Erythrobacter sp. SCN 62-14]